MTLFKRSLLAAFACVALTQAPARAATVQFDDATIAQLEAAMDAGTFSAEKLVELCLARIQAYDNQGPKLHAVMALNPRALEEARALDAERKAKGPRSPIHGIPVVFKDNFDTFDMPTTGGSVLLEGSIPPKDAFLVKKLRDAGAIIFAKVNLSEFAGGAQYSSLGGQSLNPHDLARSPSGSSGGTGVSIASGFAPLGMGTDTGGSVRGPSAANGVVGMRPTMGLLSRSGIIPLALIFDTGGPLVRNVSDLAAMLSVMVGVDPADEATKASAGKFEKDYTKDLNAGALKGARLGLVRDVMGRDPEVDWAITSAIDQMKKAGATVVDVHYPKWLLQSSREYYNAVRWPEFPVQIKAYLATIGPKYPKSLEEMIERAEKFTTTSTTSPTAGARPNPVRWALFKQEAASYGMQDYRYTSVKEQMLPAIRATVEGVITSNKLDAIIYPTSSSKTPLIAAPGGEGGGGVSGTNIVSLAGFPDLVMPAGFTGDNLPVGISFVGTAFTEGKLIGLAYSFEQATHARKRPIHTPPLPGATVEVKGD